MANQLDTIASGIGRAYDRAFEIVLNNISSIIDKKCVDRIKDVRLAEIQRYLSSREPMARHFKNRKQVVFKYELTPGDRCIDIKYHVHHDTNKILPFEREEEYRQKHGFNLTSSQFVGNLVFAEGITQLPFYATVWAQAHQGETDEDGNQVTYNHPSTGWVENKNTWFRRYVLGQSLNDYLDNVFETDFNDVFQEINNKIGTLYLNKYKEEVKQLATNTKK